MKKVLVIVFFGILISGFVLSLSLSEINVLEKYETYESFELEKVKPDYLLFSQTVCIKYETIYARDSEPKCLEYKTYNYPVNEKMRLEYNCFLPKLFTSYCDYLSKDGKICYDGETKRECYIGTWTQDEEDYSVIKERF